MNDVATPLPVVLQETGPDGIISYAHGLGLISETSSAFDLFYHYDGLGSVVGQTAANGKLAGRYAYDAWGNGDLTVPTPQIGTATSSALRAKHSILIDDGGLVDELRVYRSGVFPRVIRQAFQ